MAVYKLIFVTLAALCVNTVLVKADGAKCDCGVFKQPTPETVKDAPIISKSPQFNFECNAEGRESCANMCKALAGASKEEGPKKLCELVGTADAFVPLIYYKACSDEAWTYTGLKPTLEICCKDNNVIPCA